MANRLNNYNPEFWARSALMWLRNRKGMASRVYRGFEAERNDYGLGDTINIRKPATFTAEDAPNSTYQDLKTGTAKIDLTIHKEVPITVTDKELAYSGKRLISEHIGPMADAIGDWFDQALLGLASQVPHTYDLDSTARGQMDKSIPAIRRLMVENKVPQGSTLQYMASPVTTEALLGTSAFAQMQGAGDRGISTQVTGNIGPKYGFDFFETQNVQTLEGDATLTTGSTPVISGTPQKNALTVGLNTSTSQSVTLHEGQVIEITDSTTGIAEKYTVTADAAPSGNNWPDVPISPRLRRDLGASSTWAFVSTVGLVGSVANYESDLAFHRNAFALAMVPLPQHSEADFPGARVYTATDPESGLAIRARMFYEARGAAVGVILDALGGYTTLDPDLAVRPCVH